MAKISFDFIALGEALIDFISRDEVATLGAADYYQRFAGGEPANLARNMSLFGNRVAIGTCVGDDSFGHYIKAQLDKSGIDTSFVQTTLEANTTLVPITRTAGGTPDFMVCRGADAYLKPAQGLMDAAANCRLVHTSAFAISRDPARSTILEALKIARGNNALVSFDPNYHPAIQSDIPEFTSFLKRIYKYVDITKPSLDDCARIFSSELEPSEYAQLFIQWGAKIVIISMGADGCLLATAEGEEYLLFANPVSVVDVTGAGDAYWAGFLTALLADKPPLEAARQGQAIAELKIKTLGPLTQLPGSEMLEKMIASVRYKKKPVVVKK